MKKLLVLVVVLIFSGCSSKSFVNVENLSDSKTYGSIINESSDCYISDLVGSFTSDNNFKNIIVDGNVRKLTLKPGVYILKAVLNPSNFEPIESNPLKLRVDPGHEYILFSDIVDSFVYFYIVDKTSRDIVSGFTPN